MWSLTQNHGQFGNSPFIWQIWTQDIHSPLQRFASLHIWWNLFWSVFQIPIQWWRGIVHFHAFSFKSDHAYRPAVIICVAMFNAVIPVHSRLHFSPAQDFFSLFLLLLHVALVLLLFNKVFINAEKFHVDQVGHDWMYGCHTIFFHGVSYVFVAFEIIEDFFEYRAI